MASMVFSAISKLLAGPGDPSTLTAAGQIAATPPSDIDDIQVWRERILHAMLLVGAMLGLVAYVPSVLLAWTSSLPGIIFIDTVVMLAVVALLVLRHQLGYLVRAVGLLSCNYILGVWLLLIIGPVSEIYLLAFPILTGLLLGFRPAAGAIVLNAATLGILGYLANADFQLGPLNSEPLTKWVVISINFTFVSTLTALSTSLLAAGLERALQWQRATTKNLDADRARLAELNQRLREEIDGRRRAQEAASELAMAVEQARELILIMNLDGDAVYGNPAFCQLAQVPQEEIPDIGLRQGAMLHACDASLNLWETLRDTGAWLGPVALRSTDGSVRELDAVISPLRNDDGTLVRYVAVMRDLSREHEVELRLQQAQRLESLGTLAGGIAHDFNNILSSILGHAELALDDAGPNAPHREHHESIVRACHRARDLVRQILVFSRQLPTARQTIDPAHILEEVVQLLRPGLPASIALETDVGPGHGHLHVDPTELHQILMNLCTNAYHAMETGGGVLSIRMTAAPQDAAFFVGHPRLDPARPHLQIDVEDTGSGIDPAVLPRIFDPFFTTKAQGKGTGMGLSTVHGAVLNLGGEIVVHTEVGVGTRFSVYLPCALDFAPPRTAPATASPAPRGDGERVLFVDDEAQVVSLAVRLLDRKGYRVTGAASAAEAYACCEAADGNFALVITDQTMPQESGADLTRRLNARWPDMPIILSSGFGEALSAELLATLHLSAFLRKPYTQNELLCAVAKAVHPE